MRNNDDDFYWNFTKGNHVEGEQLPLSVHVLANSVTGGNRTVTLTRRRSLQGAHFNFSFEQTAIPFIAAVGATRELAIHKAEAEATLTLLATDAPNCVCAKDPAPFGKGGGYFLYVDTLLLLLLLLRRGLNLAQRTSDRFKLSRTQLATRCIDVCPAVDTVHVAAVHRLWCIQPFHHG